MVVKNPMSAVDISGEKLGRRSLLLAAAGVSAASIAAAQTPAPAPPPAPPPAAPPAATGNVPAGIKIGVIQAELALLQTKDGQLAKAELEKKLGPRQEQLQKQKADLDELQSKLERGGSTM